MEHRHLRILLAHPYCGRCMLGFHKHVCIWTDVNPSHVHVAQEEWHTASAVAFGTAIRAARNDEVQHPLMGQVLHGHAVHMHWNIQKGPFHELEVAESECAHGEHADNPSIRMEAFHVQVALDPLDCVWRRRAQRRTLSSLIFFIHGSTLDLESSLENVN